MTDNRDITITPANAGEIIKALRQAAYTERANGMRAEEERHPTALVAEMHSRSQGWFRLANEIEEQIPTPFGFIEELKTEASRDEPMDHLVTDRQFAAYRRAFLRVSVDNEIQRLSGLGRSRPFGGWRNLAVRNVAEREGMVPLALDRLLLGVER